MKAVVVYYSLEGNTKKIAEAIQKNVDAALICLKPKKENKGKGLSKYLWGGKSVLMKEMPDLENGAMDLSLYDKVIIGTPIWANHFTPAIRTFLAQSDLSQKKVFAFACHKGSGGAKCFSEIKGMLPQQNLVATASFLEPKDKNMEDIEPELQAFCQKIIQA